MNDMTPLQEALAPRSDQLNADDLIVGPRTLKITGARIVEGDRGGKKITLNFEGDNGKPWKPCKTMGRAMVMVWAVTDEAQFIGKSVTVYRDPEVAFGDQGKIGGIRISHMSHIDSPKTVKLTVSQGKKAQFVFQPLTAEVRTMPDAAQKWADGFKAQVGNAPDLPALENYVAGKSAKLDEMKAKRPDLHAECEGAVAARRASFTLADELDDDPFGEPTTGTDFRSRIATADKQQLAAIEDDFRAVCVQMPKPLADEIEALITVRRGEIGG